MKRLLIAAAASLLLFGVQPNVEASTVEDTQSVETQETGKWAHFRDKHILGRETENDRRDRKEREDRHRHDYGSRRRYDPPPPPPPPPPRRDRYGDGHRRYDPPPPPPPRNYPPPPRR